VDEVVRGGGGKRQPLKYSVTGATFKVLVLVLVLGAPAAQTDAVAQALRPADLDSLILAEDRRASRAGDFELIATIAASHESPDMRARAVRALGRLEQKHPAGKDPASLIERALGDPSPRVRAAAAYALAQSVIALDAAAKAPKRALLITRLSREEDDEAAAAMLESTARLADAASIAEVERVTRAQQGIAARRGSMASAFEILSRRAGKPGVLERPSLEWLRAAVMDAALSLPARRAALQALVTQRAVDAAFASRAFDADDWQIRRLAMLGATTPAAAAADARPLLDRGLRDADPHVRYEAVRATARRGADACVSLLAAAKDTDAHVALAAIDALARCSDPSSGAMLSALAASPGGVNWHRASHALAALASVDRGQAAELLAAHAKNDGWPIRMYAAQAAARTGGDETLVALAADSHPNVREAAITGLVERAKASNDPAIRRHLKNAVMSALAERRDPQLLRTAAAAVAATGDAPAFRQALMNAITALDEARGETTVDARVAIAEALKLAAPGDAVPAAPAPFEPVGPSPQELRSLPVRARIEMARSGAFELELFPDEAPATVARFARLARAGYYDGLTFHRVVPNFVIQGGSPWANEYSGAPRFQRDELGFGRHERGAVGISTRGRDTGDAQIFIDLVDLPRLNHDYTVFARVVSGMDVVDGVLEADVIRRVEVLHGR